MRRPPSGQLAPGDDGVRFIVERPVLVSAAFHPGGFYKLVIAAADEATARMWLRPSDRLVCVQIDGRGIELEREQIDWRH